VVDPFYQLVSGAMVTKLTLGAGLSSHPFLVLDGSIDRQSGLLLLISFHSLDVKEAYL
jgi:hypothetical protein